MILQKENRTKKAISFGGKSGLVSCIDIHEAGRVEDIYVGVDINHDSIRDLTVTLVSPSGHELTLHDNIELDESDLKTKYNREVLESFIGQEAAGEWRLKIRNRDPELDGTLNSWVIGMSCNTGEATRSQIYLHDSDTDELNSQQYCQIDGRTQGLILDVSLEHPQTGDLTIELVSPSGRKVKVHDRKGGDRKNLRATYNRVTLRDMLGEQSKGLWTLQVKDHNNNDEGRLRSWKLNLDIRRNDDLTVVEGIGPRIQSLLYHSGINTYSSLAKCDREMLSSLLEENGLQLSDSTTWPEQAHLAAINSWDELNAWQAKLINGRPATA